MQDVVEFRGMSENEEKLGQRDKASMEPKRKKQKILEKEREKEIH